MSTRRRKLLLIELNEITWDLVDPLIAQGKLPTFRWLKANGAWGAPTSIDLPPQLDPWITWTTVYTGRPQSAHNVFFLEQPPETIRAQRIWNTAASTACGPEFTAAFVRGLRNASMDSTSRTRLRPMRQPGRPRYNPSRR